MSLSIYDLVSNVVAIGYGVISAGNGMIVVYGEKCPDTRGVIFIPNTIHDEEAECLIREALTMPRSIIKVPKNSKLCIDNDIVPTEE